MKQLNEIKLHVANLEALLSDPDTFLQNASDLFSAKQDLQEFEKVVLAFCNNTAKYLNQRGEKCKS
tara:strand:+ start:1634 stop:1831 length:198 start_codon:yes stop_codon:yes gene_type:complete